MAWGLLVVSVFILGGCLGTLLAALFFAARD